MAVAYGPSGDGLTPNPGARIRFDAIGEAWTLLREQMATWALISGIYLVLLAF